MLEVLPAPPTANGHAADPVDPAAPALTPLQAARILSFEDILASVDTEERTITLWGSLFRLRTISWGDYERALDNSAHIDPVTGRQVRPLEAFRRWKTFYALVEPKLTIPQLEQLWERKSAARLWDLIRLVDFLAGDGLDPNPPPTPVPTAPVPEPPLTATLAAPITPQEAQDALFQRGTEPADPALLPVQIDVASGSPR